MALRRALAGGLRAAGLALADHYQNKQESDLALERQRQDDARQLAIQLELEKLRHKNSVRSEYLKSNHLAAAEELGVTRKNEDVAAPIAESIGKADSLEKAPTQEDISSQYKAGGGRETLDSRNFTSRGGRLTFDENPGGAGVLAGLQAQGDSRRKMLTDEANKPDTSVEVTNQDGSKTTKFVSKRTGGEYQTGLSAKREGELEGEKAVAGEPGKTQAENANLKGTFDERFRQEQKMAAMRAAIELDAWKKKNAVTAGKEALKAADAATAGVLQMEEIIALATEVNKGNMIGVSDVYSGARNAIGQLPWVGTALGGLMDTANATTTAMKDGDPTLIAKTNQLQALRRAAAIAVIKAAGDPRPSNADVDGVINSIPGAGESAFATKTKAQAMRDTLTLVPEILKGNPHLLGREDMETGNGLVVLQMAMREAQKRAGTRATSGRNPDPVENPAVKKLGAARQNGPAAAPPAPPPTPKQLTPQEKLAAARARRGQQ